MSEIYFVNEDHKSNFERVLFKWKQARQDREYMTACYILSVPIIYDKVENQINDFDTPVDWIWRYLKWLEQYDKSWERYQGEDDSLHPDHDAWIDRKPFDLTGSTVNLGKFALNMWTSYEDFNLMDCLGSLDDRNYNVLMCAINIRMRRV